LVSLPATLTIAKAIQYIKGGSSRWLHDTYEEMHDFAWQEGYGAFTIGVSQIEQTKRYIKNQVEHHKTKTFREEFVGFLNYQGIDFEERYLL
jgi:REP element-mobilizing transposase RayT